MRKKPRKLTIFNAWTLYRAGIISLDEVDKTFAEFGIEETGQIDVQETKAEEGHRISSHNPI